MNTRPFRETAQRVHWKDAEDEIQIVAEDKDNSA
jgi:hypothetical protein